MTSIPFRLGLAFATLGLCLPGCRSQPRESQKADYQPTEEVELGQMRNVSTSNGIWTGGLPSVPDLDLAHRRGIEVAIDLCTTAEHPDTYDLVAVCDEIGIELIQFDVEDGLDIPDEVVDNVLVELERGRRTLIFCGNGGRSAMFFAIHRILNEHVPVEKALMDARRAGMKPGAPEDFVRQTVERHRADS